MLQPQACIVLSRRHFVEVTIGTRKWSGAKGEKKELAKRRGGKKVKPKPSYRPRSRTEKQKGASCGIVGKEEIFGPTYRADGQQHRWRNWAQRDSVRQCELFVQECREW